MIVSCICPALLCSLAHLLHTTQKNIQLDFQTCLKFSYAEYLPTNSISILRAGSFTDNTVKILIKEKIQRVTVANNYLKRSVRIFQNFYNVYKKLNNCNIEKSVRYILNNIFLFINSSKFCSQLFDSYGRKNSGVVSVKGKQ